MRVVDVVVAAAAVIPRVIININVVVVVGTE